MRTAPTRTRKIRWAPDGRRFAYIIGYEGGSTFVVDVDTLASRLVVATPAIDAALRERLGGYPEFFVQSWVDGGLHFGSFCYGCDVPAVHVRAADGYTVDEILATPQPPLDVRDGHALVQDSPGGRPPGLARVDPIGTTVVLRTDTSTGTWR